MRFLASSMLRWFTGAACGSRRILSRRLEAEFPAPSQTACRLLEDPRGLCIAGCASPDALRSLNNSVKLKDQYDISFIRETSPPFAWWLPTTRRSRPQSALSGNAAGESTAQDILAATCRLFQWQRGLNEETGARITQWFASANPVAISSRCPTAEFAGARRA